MRRSSVRRSIAPLRAVMLSSSLLVAPSLAADQFFWNTSPPNQMWSHSTNWSGPSGDYPHTSTDTAYVNGATKDPILNFNIQLGYFVIQNGGAPATGDGVENYSLVVTAVGGLTGFTGFTLIKHEGSELMVRSSTNFRDFDSDNLKIQSGAALRLRDGAAVQVDHQMILQTGGVVEGNGEIDFSRLDGTTDPHNDGLVRSRYGTLRVDGHEDTVFDIDGGGAVNIADLLLLLGQWGAC